MKAQPGHLSHSSLRLKQSEKVRKAMSEAQRYNEAMKRTQPVRLDWRAKT